MIINGTVLANKILGSIKEQMVPHVNCGHRPPSLAVIVVGDNPASQIYVERKRDKCEQLGFRSVKFSFEEATLKYQLIYLIESLNQDHGIDGILVQLPLPPHLNPQEIIEHIDPKKDVDGLHPYNVGRLATRSPSVRSCTPYGIMKLLESIDVDVKGMNTVVLGASNIVGRPIALELLLAGATVTICHKFTKDASMYTSTADLVISAVGKPNVLTPNMIKFDSIIIDVGINRDPDTGKLCGDVGNFPEMLNKAKHVTPVPGGVGPMTVAMLMQNILQLYTFRDW